VFRSRRENIKPTAKAVKPITRGNIAGQYSCIVASIGKPGASRSRRANSFEGYSRDQQDGTHSDSNPKPLVGEGLPLREYPIQRNEYRDKDRGLSEIFGDHLSNRFLAIHCGRNLPLQAEYQKSEADCKLLSRTLAVGFNAR